MKVSDNTLSVRGAIACPDALRLAGVTTPAFLLEQATPSDYWLVGDASSKIGAANWNVAGSERLIYCDVPELCVIYHVAGSTRVNCFQDGRCISRGARIGSVTLAVPGSYEWELEHAMEFMHVYLPTDTIVDYLAALPVSSRTSTLRAVHAVSDPWLEGLFTMLRADADFGRTARHMSLFIDTLRHRLLDHLFDRYRDEFPEACTVSVDQPLYRLSGSILRKIEEYLRAHLNHDVSLADLARIADLSEGHLLRAFAGSTGRTPYQYLLAQRIEASRQLLSKSDRPIKEIAASLGFSSTSHFANLFKRKTGMTASAYRMNART